MKRMQSLMAGVLGAGAVTMGAGAQNAVEWHVADGGNGHWYADRTQSPFLSFANTQAACTATGGHLCTITTSAEHQFVLSLAFPTGHLAKGATWPALGGSNQGTMESWTWVTGEPFSYAPWSAATPPALGIPSWIMMWGSGTTAQLIWTNNGNPGLERYIVEYEADCNNDGLVDYGQILAGELPDANHNNIPDCCEQGTPCFLTQGLDAHYAFDGNTDDTSGHGHHAASFNTTLTTDRFGHPNSACAFDGSSGYLTASGIPIHTNNAFTWAMWIKCDVPSVHRPILHRAAAMGDNRHSPSLWTDPGGAMAFTSFGGMGGAAVDTPAGSLVAGQWRHFVGTSNANGTRRVYLDGLLVASGTSPSYGEALELLLIGRDPVARWYFTGALDDIRIYNRELSAAEVLALYHWPMVDSDGDGVADSTDNCPNIANPTQADCDNDGIGDACEIAAGALDRNHDGIPDSCQCPADITRNGLVDGVDLAIILATWGTNGNQGGVNSDVNGDGIVNGTDLATVLGAWGICQ